MRFSKFAIAILFLLAFNCSFTSVSALNFDYYGIESRIQTDGTVLNVITLTLNSSVPNLDYKLKYRVFNVKAESEHASVECEARVTDTSLISCEFEDYENHDQTKIDIEFKAKDTLRVVDENYEFTHFVPIEGDVKRFFNIVYLPETSTLVSETPEESFSPKDGKTLSDGKHIMVYWDRNGLEEGDDIYFTLTYKLPVGGFFDVGLMIIIALIIIASLGAFYMQTTRGHRSVKMIMPLLKGDEKVVVDILNKHKGSINQRVIVRESDFSKAKVSRLVADLKERGIVDVEVMGRTNKITLKVKR